MRDEHAQHLAATGQNGDQRSADHIPGGLAGPDTCLPQLPLGDLCKIDSQEMEVHTLEGLCGNADLLQDGAEGGLILVDGGNSDQLVIAAVGAEEALKITVFDGSDDICGVGIMEHPVQRLSDHIEQGEDDQQGDQRPQAACAHGYALCLIQCAHLFTQLVLILLILFLQILDLRLKPGHFHGVFLALCGHGRQDQTDQDGEQDQREAVAVCELIQKIDQITKGDLDQISDSK